MFRPAPSRPLRRHTVALLLSLVSLAVYASPAAPQGTEADYARAQELRERFDGLLIHTAEDVTWIGDSHRLWYRRPVEEGHTFVLVDAETAQKSPAFEHETVASRLNEVLEEEVTGTTLPFDEIELAEDGSELRFEIDGDDWRCTLPAYACEVVTGDEGGGRGGRGGPGGRGGGGGPDDGPLLSPDGRWEALIRNYNVVIRATDAEDGEEPVIVSRDGSEGDAYRARSLVWSPDSKKLAAYRVKPGYERLVHYVESSPEDQLQPKYSNRRYLKPGDVLEVERPVLFDVETATQTIVDDALFPNAYSMSGIEWWPDSRGFRFEYNQRGHQLFRVIEVDASTGRARALIDEREETFFSHYTTLERRYTEDGRAIVWASERDGWKHLYLYDALSGELKNRITEGEWVVRDIDRVDEESRQIWFEASGVYPDQDPYFIHHFRVDFDGTDLVALTEADGTHEIEWSEDREFYVDTWSRVDLPPVSELRRTSDRSLVLALETGDATGLVAEGWQAPEPFVAKGRDGETDIWGIVVKPTNFDPDRAYPVVEYIYAGPHDSHVPKDFSVYSSMMALAELGFVVAQIDGMGTANRGKAFHDVAWQNLKDAGFPDRILWHEAYAAEHDWYDTSRVGIYGTSAGGQNSLGALLFHPDFYHVAVSAAGCHDNRMDKISWNEQWMGWPVGDHYAESSNVDNAWRLQGNVLLVVGELDTNVPPASTLQVVDALVDADKDFDLLFLPGAGHTSGGRYGERKRWDYFVEHLLGLEPPDRNRAVVADADGSAGSR